MQSITKLPIKQFYFIIISCAVIIFCQSMDVLFKGRSTEHYNSWLISVNGQGDIDLYITILLSTFTSSVMLPMMFAIYSYIAYLKVRVGFLFVFMWSVLMLGGFAYTVIALDFGSLFYYIEMLSYVVCIGTILSLIPIIKNNEIGRSEYNV